MCWKVSANVHVPLAATDTRQAATEVPQSIPLAAQGAQSTPDKLICTDLVLRQATRFTVLHVTSAHELLLAVPAEHAVLLAARITMVLADALPCSNAQLVFKLQHLVQNAHSGIWLPAGVHRVTDGRLCGHAYLDRKCLRSLAAVLAKPASVGEPVRYSLVFQPTNVSGGRDVLANMTLPLVGTPLSITGSKDRLGELEKQYETRDETERVTGPEKVKVEKSEENECQTEKRIKGSFYRHKVPHLFVCDPLGMKEEWK